MRPKLIAGVLVGGIALLGGGAAAAASLPSWTTRPAHAVAVAPAATQAASAAPARSPSSTARPAPLGTAPPDGQAATPDTSVSAQAAESHDATSITYTVKPGDTLSGIAAWFWLHGYGALYEANKAVIGANPNLIFPGERITIAGGVMKLSKRP
jgi:nucleoid-associated protein YgaU